MTAETQIAKHPSATRRKQLRKALAMCRRECDAGCVMDERGADLCDTTNCGVYKAVARGETWVDPIKAARKSGYQTELKHGE